MPFDGSEMPFFRKNYNPYDHFHWAFYKTYIKAGRKDVDDLVRKILNKIREEQPNNKIMIDVISSWLNASCYHNHGDICLAGRCFTIRYGYERQLDRKRWNDNEKRKFIRYRQTQRPGRITSRKPRFFRHVENRTFFSRHSQSDCDPMPPHWSHSNANSRRRMLRAHGVSDWE